MFMIVPLLFAPFLDLQTCCWCHSLRLLWKLLVVLCVIVLELNGCDRSSSVCSFSLISKHAATMVNIHCMVNSDQIKHLIIQNQSSSRWTKQVNFITLASIQNLPINQLPKRTLKTQKFHAVKNVYKWNLRFWN